MTERELHQKIQNAVEHAAPDQLERILSSCEQTTQNTQAPLHQTFGAQKKGALTTMTDIRTDRNNSRKKKSFIAAAAAVAAAFVFAFGGPAFNKQPANPEIDTIILLDVNPSLSLSLDTQEIVQAVEAHNKEALDVLGTMDLRGTSLEVSLNALIGSMMQKGYLDDAHNSILVSVENQDTVRGSQLQQKVSQAITSAMHTDTMEGAVLSQTVDANDSTLSQLAQNYQISMGKAAFIQEVTLLDPTLSFDALASMSINDIALIASSKSVSSQAVTQTGTASDKSYIGKDAALAAALAHAGVNSSDAKRVHVEFDSDDGRMVYEVEFETSDKEYDYDIDASTGEVLKREIENRFDGGSSKPSQSGSQSSQADSSKPQSGSQSSQADSGKPQSGSETTQAQRQMIGEEAAKQAALAHAGVKASEVSYLHCHVDYENGVPEDYDIEFVVGNVEYDYEIDLYSGAVRSSDKEKVEADDRYDRYDDDRYDDDRDDRYDDDDDDWDDRYDDDDDDWDDRYDDDDRDDD